MENYSLSGPYSQNGAYGLMLPNEKNDLNGINRNNHYIPSNDRQYIDNSIKSLRRDIKKMSDDFNKVNQKADTFINNKKNILKNYRSY